MRGPTDEEWKRMTSGQRRAYALSIGIAFAVILALLMMKFLF